MALPSAQKNLTMAERFAFGFPRQSFKLAKMHFAVSLSCNSIETITRSIKPMVLQRSFRSFLSIVLKVLGVI